MIAKSILAAGTFVSLVAAIPLAQPQFPKREVVWETHTEIALTTIPVTVTHWLEPGETPPAAAVGQQHYGHGGHGQRQSRHGRPRPQPQTTQPAAPPPAASSPESASQPPPAPSSYEQPPAQQSPRPAPTTPQAPPPAPTSQQAPPPEPTQQAPPPAYTPPADPPANSGSNGGGSGLTGVAAPGQSYSGDLTYYDPGLGACGITSGPDEAIVAISEAIFDAYNNGNPNNNPLCGKTITITGEDGSPYTAKIVDRCPGCAQPDLDLAPGFFKKVVPTGDGRVPGVKWTFD